MTPRRLRWVAPVFLLVALCVGLAPGPFPAASVARAATATTTTSPSSTSTSSPPATDVPATAAVNPPVLTDTEKSGPPLYLVLGIACSVVVAVGLLAGILWTRRRRRAARP